MKATKTIVLAAALLLPALSAFADDAAKSESPLALCQSRVAFQYHFDMMQIEGQEMREQISHSMADVQKSNRTMAYQGELAVCKDENK